MHHLIGQCFRTGVGNFGKHLSVLLLVFCLSLAAFADDDKDGKKKGEGGDEPTRTSQHDPEKDSSDPKSEEDPQIQRINLARENEAATGFKIEGSGFEFDVEPGEKARIPDQARSILDELWSLQKGNRSGQRDFAFFANYMKRAGSGFVDLIAESIVSSAPTYDAAEGSLPNREDIESVKEVVGELVVLVNGLLERASLMQGKILQTAYDDVVGGSIEDAGEISPENRERIAKLSFRRFVSLIESDRVAYELEGFGKAKLNTVDGSLFIDVRHFAKKLSFQLVNPEFVKYGSRHLQKVINRKMIMRGGASYPIWLTSGGEGVKMQVHPMPASNLRFAGKYLSAAASMPNLSSLVFSGATLGGIQYGLSAGYSFLKTGEVNHQIGMTALVMGSLISAFNSTYRFIMDAGSKKTFFLKSMTISLIFNYAYRAIKNGTIDPMAFAIPVVGFATYLHPRTNKWLFNEKLSTTGFLARFLPITFGLGAAGSMFIDMAHQNFASSLVITGLFASLGLLDNASFFMNGILSGFGRGIVHLMRQARDAARISRGPEHDPHIVIFGKRIDLMKRGTAEDQALYSMNFLPKSLTAYEGNWLIGPIVQIGFLIAWMRVNVWYLSKIKFQGLKNKAGEYMLDSAELYRQKWENSYGILEKWVKNGLQRVRDTGNPITALSLLLKRAVSRSDHSLADSAEFRLDVKPDGQKEDAPTAIVRIEGSGNAEFTQRVAFAENESDPFDLVFPETTGHANPRLEESRVWRGAGGGCRLFAF